LAANCEGATTNGGIFKQDRKMRSIVENSEGANLYYYCFSCPKCHYNPGITVVGNVPQQYFS